MTSRFHHVHSNTPQPSEQPVCVIKGNPPVRQALTGSCRGARTVSDLAALRVPETDRVIIAKRFKAFIRDQDFPCVGAKAALAGDRLNVVVACDIRSAWDDLRIYAAILDFAHAYEADPRLFQSLAVVFQSTAIGSEAEFEDALWTRLQSLSDKDVWHGQPYDPRVSPDPRSPHFSLSFGGQGFFVVGLNPKASRAARRFEHPAIVFNLHHQFEQLRSQGRYEKLRARILERDAAIDGAPNPMLARHGEASAAPQFSGRQVGEDWVCPFHPARGSPALAS